MTEPLGVSEIYRDGSLRQEDWYPVAQVTGTNVAMTVRLVATAEPTRVEVARMEAKVAAANRLAAAVNASRQRWGSYKWISMDDALAIEADIDAALEAYEELP